MRYRLLTLVILTAIGPPILWGVYLVLKPPGRLWFFACLVASLVLCSPMIWLRLKLATMMK